MDRFVQPFTDADELIELTVLQQDMELPANQDAEMADLCGADVIK